MSAVNAIFAALLTALLALGVSGRPRADGRAQALGQRLWAFIDRRYALCALLLLALAVTLRVYRFPEIPYGMNTDGVMSTLDAWALSSYGTDRFGTPYPTMLWGWGYGQQSALYAYWASLFTRFLGLNKLSLRLPMLSVALLSLPVLFDLARRVAGRGYALMTLALCAVLPWHVVQSRWSIDAHMFCHMLLFSTYFLVLGTRRRGFYALAMVFFGLTMYAYAIAAYSVPILLLSSGVYLLAHGKISLRQLLGCAAIYLLVALPLLLTLAINLLGLETMRLGPLTLQRFSASVRASDTLFLSQKDMFVQLRENLLTFLHHTFLQSSGGWPTVVEGFGTLYVFSTPALLAGLYLFWRDRRANALGGGTDAQRAGRAEGGYLVLCWLFAMFCCGLFTNLSNTWRSNGIYYPLLLLVSYALYAAARRVKALLPLMMAVYAVGAALFTAAYFDPARLAAHTEELEADQIEALEYMDTLPFEYACLSVGTDPERRVVAEINALFVHGIDALQFQDKKPLLDGAGDELGYYSDIYEYWTEDGGFTPFEDENMVYLLRAGEEEAFEGLDFALRPFGRFVVAYPAQYLPEGGDA